MANIFIPVPAEGFELCHPDREEDFETLNLQIDGTPRSKAWTPIRMHVVHEDERGALLTSDSPWLGAHALIFRQAAVARLASVLRQHGELLPVGGADSELWIFNATSVLSALDEDASSVVRFENGRIMRVLRYELRPKVIEGAEAFKLAALRVSPTFVTERIVELWNSAHLRGLSFKRVWPTP